MRFKLATIPVFLLAGALAAPVFAQVGGIGSGNPGVDTGGAGVSAQGSSSAQNNNSQNASGVEKNPAAAGQSLRSDKQGQGYAHGSAGTRSHKSGGGYGDVGGSFGGSSSSNSNSDSSSGGGNSGPSNP